MTFTPEEILGRTPVEQDFSFSVNFTPESTENIIINTVSFDENFTDYISYQISENSVVFSGNAGLDIFDNYKIKYVDKGSSDKIMTPIVSNIKDVPDNKDIFQLMVDSRTSIDVDISINVEIIDNETEESSIETIILKIIFTNSSEKIRIWLRDYFDNRY